MYVFMLICASVFIHVLCWTVAVSEGGGAKIPPPAGAGGENGVGAGVTKLSLDKKVGFRTALPLIFVVSNWNSRHNRSSRSSGCRGQTR